MISDHCDIGDVKIEAPAAERRTEKYAEKFATGSPETLQVQLLHDHEQQFFGEGKEAAAVDVVEGVCDQWVDVGVARPASYCPGHHSLRGILRHRVVLCDCTSSGLVLLCCRILAGCARAMVAEGVARLA